MTDTSVPKENEVIHADDILNNYYNKDTVDGLVSDPTYNTTASCIGCDEDILGGY